MSEPSTGSDAVAVVIPAFNAAKWLPETLHSVLAQTVAPAEIVVVDDGSSDHTADVVRSFVERGVQLVQQPNAGPAAARNHGVSITRSPLIAFCDADDLWLPDKLAKQLSAFFEPSIVACCSDAFLLSKDVRGARRLAGQIVPRDLDLKALLRANPVVASSVVVRRSALVAAGGFDEDRVLIATEDYDLWLRLVEIGTIHFLPIPLVEYRVHGASLSNAARFAAGLDRIFEKVVASKPGDRALLDATRKRRGQAQVDLAYGALVQRQGATARRHLAAARAFGVGGFNRPLIKTSKMWAQSWFCW